MQPSNRFTRLQVLCLAIIAAGIGVTTYLTVAHYSTSVTLSCPNTGVINCAKVTSSVYSSIGGVPLAVLGIIFFLGMLPFYLSPLWHSAQPLIKGVRLFGVSAGVLGALGLVFIELFKLDAICLYCTAVHVLIFLLFSATIFHTE